jgi:protein-S-isoprenylcysteine O-methyltransferase Ste14
MAKLNFMGIGPKIGMVVFPWLIISILLTVFYRNIFSINFISYSVLMDIGIILLVIGAIFYLVTVRFLVTGLKNTQLQKDGTYFLCQNPLYSSFILMIIPGLALVMNSWLILTTSIVGYIIFKTCIKSEYAEMESFFGNDYHEYRNNTPEFFPFPWKKWFKS